MSRTHADSIFDLPQDIIFNILSCLSVKSLLQFRCVCTSSPPLISHPSFTKLHLTSTVADRRTFIFYDSIDRNNHHHHHCSLLSPPTFHETLKLQFPDVLLGKRILEYAGSNKGLICLFDTNYYSDSGTLILWNPSINKYKILDGPHNDSFLLGGHTKDLFSSLIVFGFGFVSRTCEFKVVEIVSDYVDNTNNIVFVYSLSTNSWEIKEGVSAPCYLNYNWFNPTTVKGFVNWLADREDGSHVITAFDLDNERFQVYDLPKDIAPNYDFDSALNTFGEEDSLSLSLCASYYEYNNAEKWDVWVMGEYGVVDSWKKLFAITNRDFFSLRPLVMKSDREVLILAGSGRLMLFDAIKKEMQDLGPREPESFLHALSYTASLALLDD